MRKIPKWQRTLALSAFEILCLLALHRLMIGAMAERNIASTIFAGGSHVPAPLMATAIAFLVVRLLTVLALPGMILSRLGMVVLDAVWHERKRGM